MLERVVAAAASALLEATGRIDELDGKVRRCRRGLQERRGGGEGEVQERTARWGDAGEDRGRVRWCGNFLGGDEGLQGGGERVQGQGCRYARGRNSAPSAHHHPSALLTFDTFTASFPPALCPARLLAHRIF